VEATPEVGIIGALIHFTACVQSAPLGALEPGTERAADGGSDLSLEVGQLAQATPIILHE
jgi:hypothetical protein